MLAVRRSPSPLRRDACSTPCSIQRCDARLHPRDPRCTRRLQRRQRAAACSHGGRGQRREHKGGGRQGGDRPSECPNFGRTQRAHTWPTRAPTTRACGTSTLAPGLAPAQYARAASRLGPYLCQPVDAAEWAASEFFSTTTASAGRSRASPSRHSPPGRLPGHPDPGAQR